MAAGAEMEVGVTEAAAMAGGAWRTANLVDTHTHTRNQQATRHGDDALSRQAREMLREGAPRLSTNTTLPTHQIEKSSWR